MCFEQNDEMLAIMSREASRSLTREGCVQAYVGRQRRIRDRLWLRVETVAC